MKSQAAFVRADGAVRVDATPAIRPYLALVVNPGHSEDDRPFRLDHAFQDTMHDVLRMPAHRRLDGFKHFPDRLQKNRLMFTRGPDFVQNLFNLAHHLKGASYCIGSPPTM